MTATTKTYTVREYNTGAEIGQIELTDEQVREYELSAQMPEGLITLGELPVIPESDASPCTTVYLD